MQSNVTFPLKRLMLSLFVCSVLPILLMGRSFLQSDNIFSSLASIGFGIFFTLLCFVPFYSIKHRTRLDFSAFAKNTSQTGFFFAGRDFLCLIDRADAPEQADQIETAESDKRIDDPGEP